MPGAHEVLLQVRVIRLGRTWQQLAYRALRRIRHGIYQSIRASPTFRPLREDLLMVTNADRPSVGRVARVSFLHTAVLQSRHSLATAAWNYLGSPVSTRNGHHSQHGRNCRTGSAGYPKCFQLEEVSS